MTPFAQVPLSGPNYIYHNNFQRITTNKTLTTSAVNIWSSNGQGNYWANYPCIDGNNDGIGDNAFVIDAANMDDYPLAKPVDIGAEPIPVIQVIAFEVDFTRTDSKLELLAE